MSNISSLGDLRKKEEGGKPNDKDAKKRNELFIGGLDQRGGGSGLGKKLNHTSFKLNRIFWISNVVCVQLF